MASQTGLNLAALQKRKTEIAETRNMTLKQRIERLEDEQLKAEIVALLDDDTFSQRETAEILGEFAEFDGIDKSSIGRWRKRQVTQQTLGAF